MHMVSKKDFNSAELETMRTSRSPTTVMTANGYMSNNWIYLSKSCFLKKLPQFFSWGISARIMGIRTTGLAVKKTHHQKWQDCNDSNYVAFVVPGSSTDSVCDVNRYTENPVQDRSGSTSGEHRRDPLHESTNTENKN